MRLIFDLVALRLIATTLNVPIIRFFEIFGFSELCFKALAPNDDSHLSFESTAQTSQYPQCVVPGYIVYIPQCIIYTTVASVDIHYYNISSCNCFEMLSVAFTHSAIAFVVKKEENFRTFIVIGS